LHDWPAAFKKFKNLKTIVIIDGSLDPFNSVILPVYALFFVTGEAEFGGLLGYLALVGLAASYLLARHSDRRKKRLAFFAPLLVISGFVVLAMGLTQSFAAWLALVTLYSIINIVAYPLLLAVQFDVKNTDIGFWAVRELLLNTGRFLALSCVALLFYFECYWAVFAMYAAILFAYPFLVKQKLGIKRTARSA